METSQKKRPWKRQRIMKLRDIPSQRDVYNMAQTFDEMMERALFVMCYLTGGRIREIIRMNFKYKNKYMRTKQKDKSGNHRKMVAKSETGTPYIISREKIEINRPGIQKKNIKIKTIKGKKVLVVGMPNNKSKVHTWKTIPIPIDKELKFIALLQDYLAVLRPDDELFPFCIGKAEKIISKVNMNPHYIRDIRLTHLVQIYGFDSFRLMKFAGWTTTDPAKFYIRLNVDDIVDRY